MTLENKYNPKRLNVFSWILYNLCVWMIHTVYGIISRLFPPSMTRGSDSIVDALISDETESEILISDKMSIHVGRFVKFVIGSLDFVILSVVSVLMSAFLYILFKYKLLD